MPRKRVTPFDENSVGPGWKRFYNDVYGRSTDSWQTRVGRRNREFATFANMLGLNTAFDDLHKKDGESPNLQNVRYMGEKQREQRAQVTSRCGAGSLGINNYNEVEAESSTGYVELWEGKAIEFDVANKQDVIIGGAIDIANIEGAKGRLRIFLKPDRESQHICDANIDLSDIGTAFLRRPFFFVGTTNGDSFTIRLEVEGDSDPDRCGDVPKGRKIRVRSFGSGTHRIAEYTRPNVNECMREVPYEWSDAQATPSLTMFISDGTDPMPAPYLVCVPEGKFLVFPVRNNGVVELWRQNVNTKEYIKIDMHESSIDARTTAVRFEQCGGWLYFVDGYSKLQRISLDDWKGSVALASPDAIDVEGLTPEDMQAQPGASLLFRIRNRLVLSGFAEDPNFVQYSILNASEVNAGVQYDQFSDISWFYSPDRSPKDSVCGPITALQQFENNLIIFRTNGSSVYQMGSEFSAPQQEDMFSYNIGVERQEDVCNANGNLFIYNRSEGLRRFSGSEATFQSYQIDNLLRQIPPESPRLMIAHGNKVRFYCDLDGNGKINHCFIYHTILAQQSPWYLDSQTNITWAIADQTSDTIYAMHSDYVHTMIVDQEDNYRDFDSSIPMRYDTMYKSPGEIVGHTILRRVLSRIVTNSTQVWYFGVDPDHQDRPAVWRKYVQKVEDEPASPEGVFSNTADAGTQVVNLMMRMKCRAFQVRVAVDTWDSPAMMQMIVGEYGGRPSR